MGKAGGIIGIIAGVFGVIAALMTLVVGGLGSAFRASGADTVVGLGWGGVFFSFLAIVFGATIFAKPKGGGIGLLIVAILGAIFGGTFVAVCMVLAMIGGVLALCSSPAAPSSGPVVVDGASVVLPRTRRPGKLVIGATLLLLTLIGLFVLGSRGPKVPAVDPIASLTASPVSDLRPDGELAETFELMGNHTDIQRENKLVEIKGKVVAWTLPVYEVKRVDDGYRVQTSGNGVVSAFIKLTARDPKEKEYIESLKTGDMVSFKGTVSDVTMRSLNIEPAILYVERPVQAAAMPATAQSATVQEELPTADATASESSVPDEVTTTRAAEQGETSPSLAKYHVSFDCAKATTVSEKLICGNTTLGQLDGLLAVTYRDRLAEGVSDVEKTKLKAEQRQWLQTLKTCDNSACMSDAYRRRISEICRIPAANELSSNSDCNVMHSDSQPTS